MALRCVLLATSMVCLLFVSSASARHIVADDDKNAIVGHIDYSEPTTYGVQSPEEMAYNLDADEVTLSEMFAPPFPFVLSRTLFMAAPACLR